MLIFYSKVNAQEQKKFISNFNASGGMNASVGVLNNNVYGQSGSFVNLQFYESISAYDIPLNLNWNATRLPNGVFRFDNFYLNFSKNEMLDKLSSKSDTLISESAKVASEIDSLSTMLKNKEYLNMVSVAKTYLINHVMDSVKSHSEVIDTVDSVKLKTDSLIQLKSGFDINTDTTLTKIEKSDSALVERSRKIVDDFENLKKKYYLLLDEKKKLQSNAQLAGTTIPNAIPDSIKFKNKAQKILSNFDVINLGIQSLNDSWITLYNYNFNGINVRYSDNKIIAGFAAGVNRRFYFDDMRPGAVNEALIKNENGRNFYTLSAGLGTDINNTVISYTRFNQDNYATNFPDAISLVSVQVEREIFKETQINAVLSRNFVNDPKSNGETYSGIVELKSKIDFLGLNVRVKYINIGGNYFTPGNEYLTTAFHSIFTEFQKTLLGNKLKLITSLEVSNNLDWTRTTISFGSDYKFNSKLSVSGRYLVSDYSVSSFEGKFENVAKTIQMFWNYNLSNRIQLKVSGIRSISDVSNSTKSSNDSYTGSIQSKGKHSSTQLQESIYDREYVGQRVFGTNTTLSQNLQIKRYSINGSISLDHSLAQDVLRSSIGVNWRGNKFLGMGVSGNRNDFISNGMYIDYNSNYQVQFNLNISY